MKEILKFRIDRDLEKFHTPRNLAISISSETVELLEKLSMAGRRRTDYNLG
jgi:hypothetical protein